MSSLILMPPIISDSIALVVTLLAFAALFGSALTAQRTQPHNAWNALLWVCVVVLGVWLGIVVVRLLS